MESGRFWPFSTTIDGCPRYRCRTLYRWQAREYGGFLRVVRRTVLVSSPYAYQKASWLVPAEFGCGASFHELRPALLLVDTADEKWRDQ
jgi:hypothetical protein